MVSFSFYGEKSLDLFCCFGRKSYLCSAFREKPIREGGNRDVVQLVVYLVWDQGVARSSRVIPTNKGRLAQLV